MSEETNNLTFWESVEKTDPTKTKQAQKGALRLTAINATTQIKRATEMWGQYGDTWGLQYIDYTFMDIGDTKLALIKAIFFYPTDRFGIKGEVVEFPINSSLKMAYMTNGHKGYLKIDDDFCKKLETDVTTKALSKLGFNADVFMGLYDDNRYVAAMQEEFHPAPPKEKIKLNQASAIGNAQQLTTLEVLKDTFICTPAQEEKYTELLNIELAKLVDHETD